MPRRYLKQILPNPCRIREEGAVRLFGRALQNPNLWHLNRHSVAAAVAVGLFTAFMPVPVQMLLAAAGAVALGCNLPVSVVVVWISNPITMPPIFFAAYKFGAWLLNETPKAVHFEMSVDLVAHQTGRYLAAFSSWLLRSRDSHRRGWLCDSADNLAYPCDSVMEGAQHAPAR